MKKLFKHEGCHECTYLGHYKGHDLYHCKQGTIPTVMARYGEGDEDYKSGMSFIDTDDELGEAYKRAELNLDIDTIGM